jgi:hypothetical protein
MRMKHQQRRPLKVCLIPWDFRIIRDIARAYANLFISPRN